MDEKNIRKVDFEPALASKDWQKIEIPIIMKIKCSKSLWKKGDVKKEKKYSCGAVNILFGHIAQLHAKFSPKVSQR